MEKNELKQTLIDSEITQLRESCRILYEHLTYLRSLVQSKEEKLQRNEKLLKMYIDTMYPESGLVSAKLTTFSLN